MSSVVPGSLARADRSHVIAALAKFNGKAAGQWLPTGHPGKQGQLPPDWPSVRNLPASEVIDAVAAAGPQHCVDGWSYAARAISALLEGDPHASRHLAYYAQLRAGLCVLANLGIGVFNGINFLVTGSGTIERLDQSVGRRRRRRGEGTHTIVWDALDDWSKEAHLSARFLDLLRVRNVSLKDSIGAIWPGFVAPGAVTYLIDGWGIDLARGKTEKHHRNTSSYVPQAFNPIDTPTMDCLKFVEAVWEVFRCGAVSSFDNLDRLLLRTLLQRQHDIGSTNEDGNYASGAIAQRYSELHPSIQSLASQDFLVSVPAHLDPLIAHAHSTADPATAPQMIARALLLLRVATGFTQTSFRDAGVPAETGALRPWLDPIAAARGFWPQAAPLDHPSDLWEDVRLALDDLKTSTSPPPQDLSTWLAAHTQGLPVIHQAERILVWTLAA